MTTQKIVYESRLFILILNILIALMGLPVINNNLSFKNKLLLILVWIIFLSICIIWLLRPRWIVSFKAGALRLRNLSNGCVTEIDLKCITKVTIKRYTDLYGEVTELHIFAEKAYIFKLPMTDMNPNQIVDLINYMIKFK